MKLWRTAFTKNGWDITPSAQPEKVQLLMKHDSHDASRMRSYFDSKCLGQPRPKASEMPSGTMSIHFRLSSVAERQCEMTASRLPAEKRERNPYWQSLSGSLRSMNGRKWSEITVSKSSGSTEVRMMGRWLLGSEDYLYFGIGRITAFSHGEENSLW